MILNKLQNHYQVVLGRVVTVALLMILSACSVNSEKLDSTAIVERTQQTMQELFPDNKSRKLNISLAEAIEMALSNNMDYRVSQLEANLEKQRYKIEKQGQLPSVTGELGYNKNDTQLGSTSKNLTTNVVSTDHTSAEEREQTTAKLGMALSSLDFGVSYVRAQQQSNRIWISEERRRQVARNIVNDVNVAFWRAFMAQSWKKEVEALLAKLKAGLANARALEKSGDANPEDVLKVQAALLDSIQSILSLRKKVVAAELELAQLLNLKPGQEFMLHASKQQLAQKQAIFEPIELSQEQLLLLEEKALYARPELRIADYNVRIQALDAKRVMLSMLPSINLNLSGHYEESRYNDYSSYADLGILVNYNLFNVFSYNARKQMAENKLELEQEKRRALTMAALSQLYIAKAQYDLSLVQLEYANRMANVDQRLLADYQHRYAEEELTVSKLLQGELNAILSGMQRDWVYVTHQHNLTQVLMAAGIPYVDAAYQRCDWFASADVNRVLKQYIDQTTHDSQCVKITVDQAEEPPKVLPADDIKDSRSDIEQGDAADTAITIPLAD